MIFHILNSNLFFADGFSYLFAAFFSPALFTSLTLLAPYIHPFSLLQRVEWLRSHSSIGTDSLTICAQVGWVCIWVCFVLRFSSFSIASSTICVGMQSQYMYKPSNVWMWTSAYSASGVIQLFAFLDFQVPSTLILGDTWEPLFALTLFF